MKRLVGVALIAVAAVLGYFGYQADESITGKVTELVSGGPSDRALQFYLGAAACGVVGIILVAFGGGEGKKK